MFIYEFEKGTIRTGVAIDIATNDQKFFEESYGKFVKFYDDGKHTKEDLEPVYVFATIPEDDGDDEYKLIFTKDENEISKMKIMEDKFRLAFINEVEWLKDKNKPINVITDDGYCTLTIENYIGKNGKKVSKSNYIWISWI